MSDIRRVLAAAGVAVAFGACASQHVGQSPGLRQDMAVQQDVQADLASQEGKQLGVDKPRAQPVVQDAVQGWPSPVHDDQSFTFVRAEQLEYRVRDGGSDVARWEGEGWYGSDYQKVWIKAEGEQTVQDASEGDIELQALYSQVVAPFWDIQIGARYDSLWGDRSGRGRWFGVVGVEGFAPYEFDVETALFVSEEADVSARLTTSTDLLITQRLILQPRFEAQVAAQEVPEFQVGQGLNYVELGLRLRFEFKRELAPYLGVNWIRSVGETEDLVRRAGGDASDLAFVLGLSLWF